ncbi:UNVERIFIED_CONTAM: hypothetical protein HDU68_012086 [Siphonaria sp. JEL0065]|nr:hypothetical protein HDU68_012086 [Siphonaria sp. JEL0065]
MKGADRAAMGDKGGGRGGMIGGDDLDGEHGSADDGGFGHLDRQSKFDRSFAEIMKLLEYAKSLDEAILENDNMLSMGQQLKRKSRPNTSPMIQKESNTQQHQKFEMGGGGGAGLSGSNDKNRYGRKPIKLIAEELKKRIDLLKSNQGEWEAFQERILAYHKTQVVQSDIIKHNREALAMFFPALRIRNLESAHIDHEKHRELVLKKKQKLDKDKLKKKLEVVQKKDSAIEQGRRREREENGKSQVTQKKWFLIISVAARIGYIQRVVEESRIKNARIVRENHAARVIQKRWSIYIRKCHELRKQQALATIAVVFHYYVLKRRMIAKYFAADKIRQFFKEVHDVSKLMKVVQKYRFSVVLAQRLSKGFLAVRRAQVIVLLKYWEKLESAWWTQRKLHGGVGGSNNSLDGEKSGKSKSKKKNKKSSKEEEKDRKDSEKAPALKVTDSTKIQVITEDLLSRKKQYRKALQLHQDQLAKYLAELKKAPIKKSLFSGIKPKADTKPEDDKNAPKKPIFKLLPTVQEMYQIIEKGFMLQTQANMTQPYEWGRFGLDSKAGELASADPEFKASINKLSIQAHPDKKLAERLFVEFPNVYKDNNHKPEMAVALTDFEALIGFRALEEIKVLLNRFPKFAAAISTSAQDAFVSSPSKESLKQLFKSLVDQDATVITTQIRTLIARLSSATHKAGSLEELLIRLNSQFPDDVGIFCALLLNYVSLKEGEAIFLAANEPHAYTSGDIVECMAANDNVVRSGLTPKFKDVNSG